MRIFEKYFKSIHLIRGENAGLKQRLLRSHLAVAGIGLGFLLISLIAIFWMRTTALRLTWQSVPTAQMSLQTSSGIQQSLANLRGWVVLGDDRFKKDRNEVWKVKIRPALQELNLLSNREAIPSEKLKLQEIKPLVKELESLQWWIEDVAQTPGNEPARLMFEEKIRPASDRIFEHVTRIIDSEKIARGGPERKLFLGALADFRGMVDHATAILKDYLDSGQKMDEKMFLKYLSAAEKELNGLMTNSDFLDEIYKDLLGRIEWDLKDFKIHAQEAIRLRKSDEWNIAEHQLRTKALPLETQVTNILNQLSSSTGAQMRKDSSLAIWVAEGVLVLSLLLIIFMGIFAFFVSRRSSERITQPILAIAASANELLKANGTIGEPSMMEYIGRGELTQAFKSMQFALERSHAELARSNKDLEQFAYVASHDLQEPLSKILQFSEFLKESLEERLDEKSQLYLDRMHAAAKRMRQLITDLLAYSRIQTHAGEFPEVNLNEVLTGVLSDLEFRIQQNQAKIETDPLPTLKADPTQMRQLFQNLIGNGLKYRKDSETPRIEVRYANMPDSKFCQISIKDNGIGFEQSKADDIFLPFKRLHGIGKYEGSGIGLSVCQKIVQRYGGTIRAESSPGVGSKFVFTLPLIIESR